MYEHNALGYWSGLALCLTKSEAVEHAVLRQLLFNSVSEIQHPKDFVLNQLRRQTM